ETYYWTCEPPRICELSVSLWQAALGESLADLFTGFDRGVVKRKVKARLARLSRGAPSIHCSGAGAPCGGMMKGPMKHRWSGARVLLGSILSVVCVISAPALHAADARKSAAGWKVPRTPDGKPDLQGNWTNATLTQLERSAEHGDRKVL